MIVPASHRRHHDAYLHTGKAAMTLASCVSLGLDACLNVVTTIRLYLHQQSPVGLLYAQFGAQQRLMLQTYRIWRQQHQSRFEPSNTASGEASPSTPTLV